MTGCPWHGPLQNPQVTSRKACLRNAEKGLEHLKSASPKPYPSKPHPCNMPTTKTEVALQLSERCAAEVALQHLLFRNADVIFTKTCAATNEKLRCNIEKAELQESGAALSCRLQICKPPRLGTHVWALLMEK